MTCQNCGDEGFKVEKVREKGCLVQRYTMCRCEVGQELEALWEQYPAWRGAPYKFFKRNPDE